MQGFRQQDIFEFKLWNICVWKKLLNHKFRYKFESNWKNPKLFKWST